MMWTKHNIPDLSGRRALVTGANSGIGFETALALYQAGADVVITARNENKAKKALLDINDPGRTNRVSYMLLDLSSLADIKRFSEAYINEYTRLDLLINNAGVMTPPAGKTHDGYELQFGVNFLGHFALTGHLFPVLRSNSGARVVTLGSGAYKYAESIDFDNLESEISYEPNREYAISKLANLQFAIEFQRRLDHTGDQVVSVAAHPGVTDTSLSRHMDPGAYQQAIKRLGSLMPAWQGALPTLFAATSAKISPGGYYGPDGPGELSGYPGTAVINDRAKDLTAGKLLWSYAQSATGIAYPLT